MSNASINIDIQVFVSTYVFISLECIYIYIYSSGIAGSRGNSMFNLLRNS